MFESESDKGSKKVHGKRMMFKNVEELYIHIFCIQKGNKTTFLRWRIMEAGGREKYDDMFSKW